MTDRAPAASTTWPIRAVLVLYGIVTLVTFDFIEEDAFIYFRIADNIAHGHGHTFNAGGERIEAGSSLTWQYLLVLPSLLGIDPIVFSKLFGILLGGATVYLLWRVSRRVIENAYLRVLPPLLLTVTTPFHAWVQRGLETPLYVFSIVLLAHFLLDDRYRARWHIPALLVALSRSEGFIVIVGLAGHAFFERKHWRDHRRALLLFAATLGASLLWRLVYFHDLMPHAFYSKIQEPIAFGVGASGAFFEVTKIWPLLLPAVLGLIRPRDWNRASVTLAVLALPFLWWGFRHHGYQDYNRHLVPALPLFYVFAVRGFDRILLRWPTFRLAIYGGTATFTLWLTFGAPKLDRGVNPGQNLFRSCLARIARNPSQVASDFSSVLAGRPRGFVPEARYISDSITQNWQYLVGDFIRRTYPEHITVAYDQMGQTPWYAGIDKTFIDTWGLTYRPTGYAVFNRELAADGSRLRALYRDMSERLLALLFAEPPRRITQEQAVDGVFALNPELIIVNTLMTHRKRPDGSQEATDQNIPGLIARDPRVRERYTERRKWWLIVYERNDIATKVTWSAADHLTPGKPDITVVQNTR